MKLNELVFFIVGGFVGALMMFGLILNALTDGTWGY